MDDKDIQKALEELKLDEKNLGDKSDDYRQGVMDGINGVLKILKKDEAEAENETEEVLDEARRVIASARSSLESRLLLGGG